MSNEHISTVVMDIAPKTTNTTQPAAVADKIQASIDDRSETSSEEDFTQTYSYLT